MRKLTATVVIVAMTLLLFAQAAPAQIPCSYEVTVLPPIGCFGGAGNPVAINNNGHVLLNSPNCAEPQFDRAFLWTGGASATLLPVPPGYLGFTATDLNDHGIIVGYAAKPASMGGGYHGAIYDMNSGHWTIVPPLNGDAGWSSVRGVNNAGDVCGFRSIGSKTSTVNPQTAFIWTQNDGFNDLGLINRKSTQATSISEDGTVAGISGTIATPSARAFAWRPPALQTFGPVPSGTNSMGWYADDSGLALIVGQIATKSGVIVRTFAVQADGASWLELPPLPGDTHTVATRVTASGLIGGVSRIVSPQITDQACIWVNGEPHAVADRVVLPKGSAVRGLIDIARISEDVVALGTSQGANVVMVLHPVASLPGDTNCDRAVNVADLLAVIIDWGPCANCTTDLNSDGIVEYADLLVVISHWGSTGGVP